MTRPAKEKIIVALDVPNLASAVSLVEELGETISWVKIGLQLFTAEGPPIVHAMKNRGLKIFLDLKFHDIPHTALEAVRSAVALGAGMATIHLSGGSEMVRSAVEGAKDSPLLVLGVTVLTSLDDDRLNEIGVQTNCGTASVGTCHARSTLRSAWRRVQPTGDRNLAKQVWHFAHDRHSRSAAIGFVASMTSDG